MVWRMCSSTLLGSVKGGVGSFLRTEDGLPARNSGVCKTGISGSGSVARKDCTSSCCSPYIMKGQKSLKNKHYQMYSNSEGQKEKKRGLSNDELSNDDSSNDDSNNNSALVDLTKVCQYYQCFTGIGVDQLYHV